ncbi:PREDICTED: uncharacterized protein LOC101295476, partial [Fragaria vesca subsp. vesca]|uniref:uncharacterized protein LOC101295476 n=1 Tax=Fragaria vesca subsp. vesca TaxID=101020 RepID=UPI0002C2DE56
MSSEVQAKVSEQKAYRTKKAALGLVEKSHKEQYSRVIDYAAKLKRVDPDTTVDIKCSFSNPGQCPVFKRMYVCLGACKMGFISGCRSLLGLDGCHLKSPYGGQLLSAVGLDANNTTWVVAYTMVEQESKDSWMWFLELLAKDINITSQGAGWTFISDKQKGILPAFERVLPYADHRFCVRHLWTNFNKKFPGKVLKDQLWAIAKSTTMAYFDKEMILMNQMEPRAYKWITDPLRPAKHWSRAHFNTVVKCDVLLNNLCESFNAFILPARTKPVITMFEDIRVRLMKRVHTRRDKMMKIQDPICPKPREILEKNKVKAATDCIPTGSGSAKIEVESIGGSKYVVDLQRRTCACRRWDLSGIPCKHVVSTIYFMRLKPEDFVDPCYRTKTYMDIYSNTIKPVNGMDLWARTGNDAILPPRYNRQPGRPKNMRTKDAFEKATDGTKLGRIQNSLRCSNCGTLGHNIKTCHRHLPPKENISKKRKLNSGKGTSSTLQAKGTKKPPLTKDEKRAKLKKRAEKLK